MDAPTLYGVQLYCARNKCIHDWIVFHDAVPTSYWPTVFASARHYEYRNEVIFKGLIALGDSVGGTTEKLYEFATGIEYVNSKSRCSCLCRILYGCVTFPYHHDKQLLPRSVSYAQVR
jgi:hypothetical protein